MEAAIGQWAAGQAAGKVLAALNAADISAGPICTAAHIVADEQHAAPNTI
ncbi:MAG TPA: hypothetical protein VJ617_10775 [Arthrobacter sp.]|nr:hypothetical protein [Arthrobacter sp.]